MSHIDLSSTIKDTAGKDTAGPVVAAGPAVADGSAQALYVLGLTRLAAGDTTAAVALLRRAAEGDPGRPGIWTNLARAHLAGGDPTEAVAAAARGVACAPEAAAPAVMLALALVAAGRPAEAVAPAMRAAALDPAEASSLFALGVAQAESGDATAGEATLRRAIAAAPGDAAAHLALANALVDLDRLDDASARIDRALALAPHLTEAWISLGHLAIRRMRLDEAVAAAARALSLAPGHPVASWNLGIASLLAGDWGPGWALYESRKRHPRHAADFVTLPAPVWRGEAAEGRTILVLAEQGLGDAIQFARYLPRIAARGARVAVACAPALVPLLRRLSGVAAVAREAARPAHDLAAHDLAAHDLPVYDLWVDQMSLPGLFGTRPDSVPDAAGYLPGDPQAEAAWDAALPGRRDGMRGRVGIVWAGNPRHSNDRHRSLPPADLAALLRWRRAGWVSLQVGPRAAESGLPSLAPALTDFAQTAAAVAALDLVITVDTSVAHVAGALGVPCWVMLPFAPDWRWLPSAGPRTPWYDSVRLFRQPAPGDWASVIADVGAALA